MTKTKKGLFFTAGIALATVFTLSCMSDGSFLGDGNSSSSDGGGSSPSGGLGSSSSRNEIVYGSFTDERDGKEYKTIAIGTQTWLAENLNFQEEKIGPTRGSKCYNDMESNCAIYGRLYEWYDAVEVCPDGWHLSTRAEWDILISFVGNDAGKKLKAIGSDWRDGSGTDNYGFGALPGGWLTNEFADINISGYWWTPTDGGSYVGDHYYIRMSGTENNVQRDRGTEVKQQLSVRCVLGYSSSSSIAYGELDDKRDGKKYRTVSIGTQNWMAENLNFETGGVCYNNKESNCNTYGRLYNWETAKTVCPNGWKLPTRSEWDALISYVGRDDGKKLKAKASDWGDGYGIDKYGFGALPGGWLTNEFADINISGYWWTVTEGGSYVGDHYYIRMSGTENNVQRDRGTEVKQQLSVRCIEE